MEMSQYRPASAAQANVWSLPSILNVPHGWFSSLGSLKHCGHQGGREEGAGLAGCVGAHFATVHMGTPQQTGLAGRRKASTAAMLPPRLPSGCKGGR